MPVTQPFDPALPFTRADARAQGITEKALRGPAYQCLFYDVYVAANVPVTPVLRAQAALRVTPPGAHASHFTAAEIWRACPPEQALTHVTVPRDTVRPRRRGIRAHQNGLPVDVVSRYGVRLSSPAQTFLDLAADASLVDLVVVGDSLVREAGIRPGILVRAADQWAGDGARLARRAARLVRKGVDSAMESRLRMLIVLAGLPEPDVNVILEKSDGSWKMRFDLCYPRLKLIVEYDGRQHAEDDDQWGHDIDRREELDRLGWRIIVVRSKGIYVEPERTLHRVLEALRERGARGLPRRFSSEWRQHFPGRRRA